jgi:hypothetical protein
MAYVIVALSLSVVGWVESTMCSSTVIQIGGHLIYDSYIPISMLGCYLCCYSNRGLETSEIRAE